MKKSRFLGIVLPAMAVWAIVFTGTAFAGGASEAKDKELIINSDASDQAPKDAFANIVATFQNQNPDIKVTVNTTAHEQFKTLFPTWLASKDAPDIATWFAGFRMQTYASKGLLDPILDSDFPGGAMEKEFPAAFKGASSYNGKIYFMPTSWYWWAMYYNKAVFQKLNLQTPKTWDDFLKVCDALKAAGIAPIAIGAKDTWTTGGWFDAVDAAVNGGDTNGQIMSGKIPYTDPRVKNTFDYLASLSSRGYIMPNATSYSWQEAAAVLFKGDAGMYLMGQFIKDAASDAQKPNIDFFRFPIVGNNTNYSVDTPTDGFLIPKNGKHKQAVQKFMAFLATKETQEALNKPLGRLSANINVPVPNADAQRGLDLVKGATYAFQFYDRDAPEEMAAKGMNAVIDTWANPGNVSQILAALDKDRERIYAALQ